MTRKIGGHVSTAGGLTKSIQNTLDINGNCIQIFAGSPRTWARTLYSPKEAADFVSQIDKLDLKPVYIHALYLINLASDNPDTLSKSLNSLKTDLQNSVAIRSAGVIVHIGSSGTKSFADVQSDLVIRIKDLLDQVPTATLILENSAGQKGKIGTLFELSYLINQIDNTRLKICLDTAHLFAAGYDFTNQAGLEKLISELNEHKLIPHLSCLHLNGCATKLNSRHDVHANLDQGFIPLQSLRNLVNHPLLINLPLILEVPGDPKSKSKGPDAHNIALARQISDQ